MNRSEQRHRVSKVRPLERRSLSMRSAGSLMTLLLGTAGLTLPAHAIDLVEAWRAAQEHDLEYAAARAAHDAGQARRDQGAALWRPSVDLTGTAGRMSSSTETAGARFSAPGFGRTTGANFDTSVSDGNATSWSLLARQPLISGTRMAHRRELDLSAELADEQWQAERQSLMLRTAERYFDVVVAEESLRVLQEQQGALERAFLEAQERFRVGASPITDTHEARARAEAAKAQIIAAATELQIKRLALSDVTGLAPDSLHPRLPGDPENLPDVTPLDHWLEESANHNPRLRMQSVSVELAKQEVAKSRATASPSLDLVAKVGRDRLSGSGDLGTASNTNGSKMVGVQLTIPVFTGGYRSAQHEEALSLAEKARLDEARTRQQVMLQTRASWMGLTAGAGRVAALVAAREASRARLDSTRLGQQVGDRSTLDVLNAQADVAATELGLLQARMGLLTERLRLAAVAGSLDEDLLRAVGSATFLIPTGVKP